jgi:hypothetical protein
MFVTLSQDPNNEKPHGFLPNIELSLQRQVPAPALVRQQLVEELPHLLRVEY